MRLHLEGCKPAEVSGTLERQRARGVVLVAAEAVEGEQHDIGILSPERNKRIAECGDIALFDLRFAEHGGACGSG